MPGKTLLSLTVSDAAAWREWLSKESARSPGVWLTLAKKGTIRPTSLSLTQALEEALCYGWINGQGLPGDNSTYSGRFTPRAVNSIWAKRNVDIVERLEREGRMEAAGRAAVEAAKANGRWEKAYAGPATAETPEDLLAAIKAEPAALRTWDGIDKPTRWMMYFQLNNLRTAIGREKKIRTYVDLLARGEMPAKAQGPKRPRKNQAKAPISSPASASVPLTATRSGRVSRPPKP